MLLLLPYALAFSFLLFPSVSVSPADSAWRFSPACLSQRRVHARNRAAAVEIGDGGKARFCILEAVAFWCNLCGALLCSLIGRLSKQALSKQRCTVVQMFIPPPSDKVS